MKFFMCIKCREGGITDKGLHVKDKHPETWNEEGRIQLDEIPQFILEGEM